MRPSDILPWKTESYLCLVVVGHVTGTRDKVIPVYESTVQEDLGRKGRLEN